MSLTTYPFSHEYRSGCDDLIKDFYHPALERSSAYWRAVGFFSSSALEAIGMPMGEFVAHGGTMRLVTSVRLEEDDLEAIERGLDRTAIFENRLLEQVRREFASPIGRGAYLLSSLLELGRLDIRIAMPRTGRGIYHEKVGIFFDGDSRYVTFSGSSNESRSGLEVNYECVDVFTSWEDARRANAKRRHFEQLWEGTAPGAETLAFPDAVRQELIQVQRASTRTREGASKSDLSLWKHQAVAVSSFLEQKRGVLEMATGTGKTRTALHICRQLVRQGAIDTMVVAMDGNDLLDQWYYQLLNLSKSLGQRFAVVRHYREHRERDHFLLNPRLSILLVSRFALAPALAGISPSEAARTLLIHDEVHRLGSPGNREGLARLSDDITFRLGLSATPEREYDRDGNTFIEEHIGPVLTRFELADAIRRGILAPFEYFPIEYTPSSDDKARIQQVYRKAAARKAAGEPMTQEELWIELANVYKTSRAKLAPFADFIGTHADLLRRCIIFVETREYGDEVLDIVHHFRPDFHTYYGEDDASTLARFADGELECLITCHRLSEGIDIRSLETVILFSSARARLETIQRIGRCLRANPEQPTKRANVVDFVRVCQDEDGDEADNADTRRRDWLASLAELDVAEEA